MLILSWEYPPQMVGGLGQHVYELSRHLVETGVVPHVLTPAVKSAPAYEVDQGVHIHRIGREFDCVSSFKGWIMSFNSQMVKEGTRVCRSLENLRVIHAHDWLVAYGARSLGKMFNVPIIATIHATEWGRNNGLHNRTQMEINDIERNLTLAASRVICCSHYMQDEVNQLFAVKPEQVAIIPNGVSLYSQESFPMLAERANKIFFIGRLVPEKGVQVLIDAMPIVLDKIPDAQLIIGGRGPCFNELDQQAEKLGVSSAVLMPGYITEDHKESLFREAAVAVFPSLYEPFGIVALEAMAAGTPVVVSEIGGLGEIVSDQVNGLKVPANNPVLLAEAIIHLLTDRQLSQQIADNARQELKTVYNWRNIAELTQNEYQKLADSQPKTYKVVTA
ncbi:MAG: glycosyltransferase family 4 protein [Methylocystaceae bacterium]